MTLDQETNIIRDYDSDTSEPMPRYYAWCALMPVVAKINERPIDDDGQAGLVNEIHEAITEVNLPRAHTAVADYIRREIQE